MNLKKKRKIKPKNSPFTKNTQRETTHTTVGEIRGQMTEHGQAGTIFNSHRDLNSGIMVTPTTTHTKGSHTCRDTPQSNTKQNDHTINLVLET